MNKKMAGLILLKEVLTEYKEVFEKTPLYILYQVETEILKMNISELFGIDLSNCYSYGQDYYHLAYRSNQHICKYGEKIGRTISWPDDGRQPEEGEWLYQLSFPTGAYFFNSEYPKETFKEFFNELKSYGAKYVDTVNSNLYFTHETAKTVHENYKRICKKYMDMVSEELKQRKIDKLKEELKELEGK